MGKLLYTESGVTISDEGMVMTNYIVGDCWIEYSKKKTFKTEEESSQYYEMPEEEADSILCQVEQEHFMQLMIQKGFEETEVV